VSDECCWINGECWEVREEKPDIFLCEEDQCPRMAVWYLLAVESDGRLLLCDECYERRRDK
jgi:hypothetical protein